MSLRYIAKKIKPLQHFLNKGQVGRVLRLTDTVNFDGGIICAIILISAVNGFGVGWISNIPEKGSVRTEKSFSIDFSNMGEGSDDGPNSSSGSLIGNIVASKNGTKYYKVTCSGANRIKEENKIYFQTVEEAIAAGYGEAKGCF